MNGISVLVKGSHRDPLPLPEREGLSMFQEGGPYPHDHAGASLSNSQPPERGEINVVFKLLVCDILF